MCTDELNVASGILRPGNRDRILEFVLSLHSFPEIPIESATVGRELGLMRDIKFRLAHPPKWNPDLECWDLSLPS